VYSLGRAHCCTSSRPLNEPSASKQNRGHRPTPPLLSRREELDREVYRLVCGNLVSVAGGAVLGLDHAAGQALGPDDQLEGDAEQVGVGEGDAGRQASVVVQGRDLRGGEFVVQPVGGGGDLGAAGGADG